MELSDFKTYVKYDFKRTDKDTEMIRAYNDMITWVALQMPHSAYKYQSYIYTDVGVEDYPLPTDMIYLVKPIRLLDGSASGDSGYPLDDLTKEEYDELEPNPNRTGPTTGKPTACCIFSRSILLHAIPDSTNYILEINWSKRPTVLSGDTDQPALGSEWDEILKWGTLERLYAGMGQYDESAYWGSRYHMIQNGNDTPIGSCRKLFEIEKNIEGNEIGRVVNNNL